MVYSSHSRRLAAVHAMPSTPKVEYRPHRPRVAQWRVLVVVLSAAALALGITSPAQASHPFFWVPFQCGQTWQASTWSGHNPQYSVDWNFYPAEQEVGKLVVSSKSGTVTQSHYSTSTGYGHVVEVDHGGGWRTFYAHLSQRNVSVGQKVYTGQRLGVIGSSSAKYRLSPHLHYEQRLNGVVQKAVIQGTNVPYFTKTNYKSSNCPGVVV